jgi:PAS domain S-box-containing protein
MNFPILRLLSVILQVATGLLAFRLIRVTGRRFAWSLIGVAVLLMSFERSLTFANLLFEDFHRHPGILPDILGEYVALYISALMFFGIAGLTPLFESLQQSSRDLRESERKYRTLLENLPQRIFLKDRDGIFQSCNENYARDLNIAPASIVGKTDFDFYSRETAERNRELERRAIAGGEILETEEHANPPHGRGWLQKILTPIRSGGGEVAGILVSLWDITEKKKSEQQRRLIERKMQQAQKFEGIGVLAGGIAHDFNNLLTGVLGNVYLAKREIPKGDSIGSYLREIEDAADRAAQLTNQMLAYSGQGRYIVRPISLNHEIQDMTQFLKSSISKKAEIVMDLDPALSAVAADASQMRQVILNLITNASDAIGDQNGVIRLSTGTEACSADRFKDAITGHDLPAGEYVFLKIADTGCGIELENRAQLFEPFYTTKFTGRGLGLAATLGIVRGHGGAIRVDSAPGEGSTFTVYLPTVEERAEQAPEEILPEENGTGVGRGTVLVVDDEETVCNVAQRLLELAGFSVLTASNGSEAVEVFRRHLDQVDVVLLDMTMPLMDGRETFRELQRIRPDVNVVLSSAYKEGDVVRHFDRDDLAGFVQKPFHYRRLYAVLQRAIEGGRPDPPAPSPEAAAT